MRALLLAALFAAQPALAREVTLDAALFDVPDGWTQQLNDGKYAQFTSADGYVVIVADAPTIHSRADVDKALADSAAGLAKNQAMRDVVTGETEVYENDHGVEFTGARSDAASDKGAMVMVTQFAKLTPGRYVVVMTAGTEAVDTAEEDHYGALIDSLRPAGL